MGRSLEAVAAQAMQRGARQFLKGLQKKTDAVKPINLMRSGGVSEVFQET